MMDWLLEARYGGRHGQAEYRLSVPPAVPPEACPWRPPRRKTRTSGVLLVRATRRATRLWLRRLLDCAATLGLVGLASAEAPRALKVRGYVDADGAITKAAVITMDGGRIISASAEPPEGAIFEEFPDGIASPGLIDLDTQLTAVGQVSESARAVEAGASAADAFNPYAHRVEGALRAGVTTFVLSADDRMLVGGRSAVYATGGAGDVPVQRGPGPMKLSLSPAVLRESYEPSSRAGALRLLREEVAGAKAQESAGDDALAQFAHGKLTAFATAPFGADVLSLAEWAKQENLKLVLLHNEDAVRVVEATEPLAGIIVGPLTPATPARFARSAGVFAKAGRKVAISGGLPFAAADSLRLGAAVAARHGLPANLARLAITAVPAELLGMQDEIGTLQPGRVADVVIFSGDPLDLRSRVLAVYVSGACVFRAPVHTAAGTNEGVAP